MTDEPGRVPHVQDWRTVAAGEGEDDRPLLVVHGNCQAESLRVLLTGALGDDVRSVRIPPVFELLPEDVESLHALLRRTSLFVTQPIVDGYHDLPLGHRELAAVLPSSATTARVPVLRWAALHPTLAIVRAAGVGDPPVVPYHDLRVLAAAAVGSARVSLDLPPDDAVRAVREISRQALLVRQQAHDTVDAVAAFERAGGNATWTINHPTNQVLLDVATQVLSALRVPRDVPDPGRTLLSATSAPVAPSTLNALGVDGETRPVWTHHGRAITEEQVAAAHLDWYGQHPQVVDAGLVRHRTTLDALGL